MATKKAELDSMTVAVERKEKEDNRIMVPVFLPELPGGGDGVKVDQYEHVTIANEQNEEVFRVLRGETVDIPVNVFINMKAKYPKL